MRVLVCAFLFLWQCREGMAKTAPDTVTFWQVYLNGYLVKGFNETERDPNLTIEINTLTKGEKFLLKYFRDTPCTSCPTHLLILDDQKNEVLAVTGKGTFSPLSFLISRLVEKWNTQTVKYFEAYYFENNSPHHRLLFVLKFE